MWIDFSKKLILLIVGVGVSLLIIFWFVEHKVKSPLVHFYHFYKRLFIAGNVGYCDEHIHNYGRALFFNNFIQSPYLINYSSIHAGTDILPIRVSIFFIFTYYFENYSAFWLSTSYDGGSLTLIALDAFLFYWTPLHATYHFFWLPLLLTGLGLGLTFP
ncbi:hypothetical protein [Coxiella-like endosymbiont]|uniref:hypothetical protein n=1 Tax=Coxiella-like endosymbiont TaxID=1592897 RepID=UPI00272ACECE|nr:hypothetical protein [Coxiella-like endosymbiont]